MFGLGNMTQENRPATPRPPMVHHESHKPEGRLPYIPYSTDRDLIATYAKHAEESRAKNKALEELRNAEKKKARNSVQSNATDASNYTMGGRKKYIGPWELGKTLGKGATARVRAARHSVTGQMAAVKIIQKNAPKIVQAGSLATISMLDRQDEANLEKMPLGIEREVAIMKLVDHPHVLRLYDIWENRQEIYMVLEFAQNGELFEQIAGKGRLPEDRAVKYFRQMLSAVSYCHKFNICHRDLKPENILLDEHDNIKIADFGMAAVQQHVNHRLTTSCGSPHYAAPEVIGGKSYKGDKADVWSLGVILYAMVCGFLPFDHPHLPTLLDKIRAGKYNMDANIASADSIDLVRRMLDLNATRRPSLDQLWRHPLVKKYDYLDNFGNEANEETSWEVARPIQKRSDINADLLRHLRSLWHKMTEDEIVVALLSPEPNDQKMFYYLWQQYQSRHVDYFHPEIEYSTSDYHHIRPLSEMRKLSTRIFASKTSLGERQVSKFTIISNNGGKVPSRNPSKSSACETAVSYDPYRASRQQNFKPASRANIIVYRSAAERLRHEMDGPRRMPKSSSNGVRAQSSIMMSKKFGTRSSLTSSVRSRASMARPKQGLRYRRGVSFPHVQPRQPKEEKKDAEEADEEKTPRKRKSPKKSPVKQQQQQHGSEADQSDAPYIRSRKSPAKIISPKKKANRATYIFNEEVRQVSHALAQEAEEAFNTSALSTMPSSFDSMRDARDSTPLTAYDRHSTPLTSFEHNDFKQMRNSADSGGSGLRNLSSLGERSVSRPLPVPPARSESVMQQIAIARRAIEQQRMSGGSVYKPNEIERMVEHMNRLQMGDENDKRAFSAPTPSGPPPPLRKDTFYDLNQQRYSDQNRARNAQYAHLPRPNVGNRTGSAPEPRLSHQGRHSRGEGHRVEALGGEAYRGDHYGGEVHRGEARRGEAHRVDHHRGDVQEKSVARVSARMVPPSSPVVESRNPRDPRNRPISQASQATWRTEYQERPETRMTNRHDHLFVDEAPTQIFSRDESPEVAQAIDQGVYSRKEKEKERNGWFRRSTNQGNSSDRISTRTVPERPQNIPQVRRPDPPQKKNFLGAFGALFKKRNSQILRENEEFGCKHTQKIEGPLLMTIVGIDTTIEEERDDEDVQWDLFGRAVPDYERKIEPQQTWMDKFFGVKPQVSYLCMNLTRKRTRQELSAMLKDWRRYGVLDVKTNKKREMIFASIGKINCKYSTTLLMAVC